MSKKTLLIVDDEPNVLKSLRRLFAGTEYSILLAESGEEGLKLLKEHDVQLVISDYRMPGMTGVQLLREVKELYPDTIRIILSGYADVAAIVEAINDGQVYKFLAKPWNDQEILTTVQRSFEHALLQNENSALLGELRLANQELKNLTRNLGLQVEERTRDLQQKNRALLIAQNILNRIPIGVVGVDPAGLVVYKNLAASSFAPAAHVGLGLQAEDTIDIEVREIMDQSFASGQLRSGRVGEAEEIRVICTPLPDKAGVIVLFGHSNVETYGSADKDTALATEEYHGR